MSKNRLLLSSILTLALLAGCSTPKLRVSNPLPNWQPVQPWERGTLSIPAMQFGTDGADAAIDDHLYFSKEATSGGRGFGGGGCGCN